MKSREKMPGLLMGLVDGGSSGCLERRVMRLLETLWARRSRVASAAGCAAMMGVLSVGVVMFGVRQVLAQGAARALEFDVVSVKAIKSVPGDPLWHTTTMSDGFSVIMPLSQFVARAYGIRQDLVSGLPAWADSTAFAIEAKVASTDVVEYRKQSQQQRERMLQSILRDRFKLSAHTVTRQLPVYELVLTKRAMLQESRAGARGSSMGPGLITCTGCSMSALAEMLSQTLQRNVLDRTEATGVYDIKLRWSDSAGPSLFTALEEQAGVKVEPNKGPVQTLVVDHIDPPSEN